MPIDYSAGRTCTQCDEYKDASHFNWKDRKSRLSSRCRECRAVAYKENPVRVRQRSKEWYYANRERALTREKTRRRANVRHILLSAAKKRARESGLPFDLTLDDIVVPDCCPVLGMPLMVNDGRSRAGSPSLDRIVPRLGYVRGNILVVSHRANTIKSDASVSELFLVARFYARHAEEGTMIGPLCVQWAETQSARPQSPDLFGRGVAA